MDNTRAFPTHPNSEAIERGMTLRDYFAAAALSRSVEVIAQFVSEDPNFNDIEIKLSEVVRRSAILSWAIADAMLKEREK